MLFIVATPIGNLEDISLRALRILREVDLILCEDTRVTRKLLGHYQIKTSTLSYHSYSRAGREDEILSLLKQGKNLALVSDAGTPGVSDPGARLVKNIVAKLPEVEIACIPGPSALTAAASLSVFPSNKFLFLGFLPRKKGRRKLWEDLQKQVRQTIIFYESPHRIKKTLETMREFFDDQEVEVYRELTKKFETVYRGRISAILAQLPEKVKGEIVVILRLDNRLVRREF